MSVTLRDRIANAALLTADNGRIPIMDQDRRLIAVFDNGIVLVASGARNNPTVRSALMKVHKEGIHSADIVEVDANTIIDIYRQHKTVGRAVVQTDVARQKILQDLLAVCTREKASDIIIRVLPEYTEIRKSIFNRMVMHSSDLTMEDGRMLIRATLAIASDQGNSTSDNDFQQGALTDKSGILPPGVEMVRLQYSPTTEGRGALVMRLKHAYGGGAADQDISSLGYDQSQADDIREMRIRTNGLYVLSGKVSSGKSTTLQRVLNKMFTEKRGELNMFTIEEPIELDIPGAIQIAAKKRPDGLDGFEEAMKASLRSNPNVIILGEVRTRELAQLAIEAAMTGHALWTTIHAGSALGILDRLADLRVEAWKLEDPKIVRGLVYQRLMGVLCPHCRITLTKAVENGAIPQEMADRLVAQVDKSPDDLYCRGLGCEHCRNGLVGRTVVAETILTDQELLDRFKQGNRRHMREYWLKPKSEGGMGGMPVLHHALAKVGAGMCDVAEMEEEVDLLSVYESDFAFLKPRLIKDIAALDAARTKK